MLWSWASNMQGRSYYTLHTGTAVVPKTT